MKKFKLVFISLSAAALIGCGGDGEDDTAIVVSEETIEQDLAKMDEMEIPDVETLLKDDAGASGGAAAPPGAPVAGAGPAGVMLEAAEDGGVIAESPLKLMQEAVMFYHSPAERGLEDKIEELLGKMNFETEQAYDRARTEIEARMQIPPLQSLEGLVKARIIAKIPPAPEGKKWAYDPATKQVSLDDL